MTADAQLIIVLIIIAAAVLWVIWRLTRYLRRKPGTAHEGCHVSSPSALDQCANCPVSSQCGKKGA